MAQDDLIERRLRELRHELANALLIVNICLDLHRNHGHLLRLLHTMLLTLTENVHVALEVLPAEAIDGTPSGLQKPLAPPVRNVTLRRVPPPRHLPMDGRRSRFRSG